MLALYIFLLLSLLISRYQHHNILDNFKSDNLNYKIEKKNIYIYIFLYLYILYVYIYIYIYTYVKIIILPKQ